MTTSRILKRAWIRNNETPAGVPSWGYFDCECGRKVKSGHYGEGPSVKCECGLRYSNTGWIDRSQNDY